MGGAGAGVADAAVVDAAGTPIGMPIVSETTGASANGSAGVVVDGADDTTCEWVSLTTGSLTL